MTNLQIATSEPPRAESSGYDASRFNALRHGILSRHTVLPWETESEYHGLLEALTAEHQPEGPTEEHLVEELAGIMWRKRRLRMAEGAAFHVELRDIVTSPFKSNAAQAATIHTRAKIDRDQVREAISATGTDTQTELQKLDEDRSGTEQALAILLRGGKGAYERALKALDPGTRDSWLETVEDWRQALADGYELEEHETPHTPVAASLQSWLKDEMIKWYEEREAELRHRNEIRDQAFGEAYLPKRALEGVARYETHLDRKFERTVSMLVRLQELRRTLDAE